MSNVKKSRIIVATNKNFSLVLVPGFHWKLHDWGQITLEIDHSLKN